MKKKVVIQEENDIIIERNLTSGRERLHKKKLFCKNIRDICEVSCYNSVQDVIVVK